MTIKKKKLNSLIFDIGKTNKKYFIFDEYFNIIERQEKVFPEIVDNEGFSCDDINKISTWIIDTFTRVTNKYTISFVNFSTYGASLVHLDENDMVLLPILNYLKPFPKSIEANFKILINDLDKFSVETSSPYLGMLNSGLQLYYIKKSNPIIFDKIQISLHFPQFCSFLLTNNKFSEYTSIGCHTGLWNFSKNNYHNWIDKENIKTKLAPIVKTCKSVSVDSIDINIGVGIHDSSAALVPYILGSKEKFILISTGTWSITLNPFSNEELSIDELKKDCLQFMQPNGNPVKASRLFLGNELDVQLKNLNLYFSKAHDYFKNISFNENIYNEIINKSYIVFHFESLNDIDKRNTELNIFKDFETAYHQLMIELVKRQIESLNLAIGTTKGIRTIYIDGGFVNNDLYLNILAKNLPKYKIKKAQIGSGSALGAAIIINSKNFNSELFNKILKVEEIKI